MYAVLRTGGKQYKVSSGDLIIVEKLEGAVGDALDLSDVLMVGGEEGVEIGKPLLEGALVKAKIVRHQRGKKVVSFKFKRRKNYSRKAGHRQPQTLLKIETISIA